MTNKVVPGQEEHRGEARHQPCRTARGSGTTGWAARTTSPPTGRSATRSGRSSPTSSTSPGAVAAFLGRAVRYLAARRRHPPVPRHRHRPAHGRQHPRGRPAHRPRGADRVRRQRPAGPGPRPRAADQQPGRRHRLRRRRRARPRRDPARGAARTLDLDPAGRADDARHPRQRRRRRRGPPHRATGSSPRCRPAATWSINDGTNTSDEIAGSRAASSRGRHRYTPATPTRSPPTSTGWSWSSPGVVSTTRWRPDPTPTGEPAARRLLRRRPQTIAGRVVVDATAPSNCSPAAGGGHHLDW